MTVQNTSDYKKDFDAWTVVKKRLHTHVAQTNNTEPTIRPGEIRWAHIGVNIGSEIDGKGNAFTRPVLIVHVVGRTVALVVPLTSKTKQHAGYIPFAWQRGEQSLCMHHMKTISQKRLLTRIAKISSKKLRAAKEEVKKFYTL